MEEPKKNLKGRGRCFNINPVFAEHLLCSQHKYPPPIPSSESRIYLFPCHCRRKKDPQSCKSLAPDDPVAEGQSEIGTQTPVPVKLALSTHLPFPPGPASTLSSVIALPVSSPPRHCSRDVMPSLLSPRQGEGFPGGTQLESCFLERSPALSNCLNDSISNYLRP